ncbi:MAG: hypothetical protein R6V44_00950 [Paracoccaceae bacterium]
MSGLRIMIVEDDALLAALHPGLPATTGHEVCATETTEPGAAAAAARQEPDLIPADVGLAGDDGRAVMRAIARRRAIPHACVTGGPPAGEDLSPEAVVLRKPFTEVPPAQAIDGALAQSWPPPI